MQRDQRFRALNQFKFAGDYTRDSSSFDRSYQMKRLSGGFGPVHIIAAAGVVWQGGPCGPFEVDGADHKKGAQRQNDRR